MPRTCLKMQPLTPPSATTLFLCNILPSPFSSPAQSAATKTASVSHCSDHTRPVFSCTYPEVCASGSLDPCVFCKQFHSAVIPGPHGASSAPETFLPLAFVFTSYCLPGPAHATSPAHIHLILFHSTWPHHLQCRLLAWLRRLLTVLLPQEALSKSLPRGQVLPGICQVHGKAGRKISVCISFKPLPLLTTLISAAFHWVPT